jgi:putative PEP-CTERM system TPR-repeat lipoprotein
MKHCSRVLTSVAVIVLVSACTRDPQVKAQRAVASGDAYAVKHQNSRALIEYKRAVQFRPEWADAHYKLAKAYEAEGDAVNAYREYARTGDLDLSNTDAQVKAGMLLLAAGEFDAARARAELALTNSPGNVQANILMGSALAGLNQTDKAVKQIEQAISLDPSNAPAWMALGAVQFRSGTRADAAAAFQKAVDFAPKSVDARLAQANYQWASGDTAAAEATLKVALAMDAASSDAHRALALLYLSTRRIAEAEPHFKALASQPGGQLALADYYTGAGARDKAMAVLHGVEAGSDKIEARAATLRIAAIQYAAGNRADAYQIVDRVLKDSPKSEEAHVVKARMLLMDQKPDEAANEAQAGVKLAAGSVAAQYTLGLTAIARHDRAAAENAFQQVLKLNPRAAAARLQLARLQLARGEAAGALESAEEVSRELPDDVDAAVLMSRSLRAQGNLPRAEREIAGRIARNPNAAGLHLERGWLAIQNNDVASARKSFEEALRLAPSSYDALVGLVTVDIAQRNIAAARSRVAAWQERAPNDSRVKVLSARVSLSSGDRAEAERTLRALVTADPSQLDAYDLLGQIAVANGQLDRALSDYQTLANRSQAGAAGPLTMVGMIQEARGDRDSARSQYERVMLMDPGAGVAANNLAWIYADAGRLDEALKFATVARERLKRPESEDTLGWVYYKKGLLQHAITSFERAAAKAPRNPVYQYHLGLAHLREGNEEEGRAALKRALAIKSDFNGADEARKALAEGVGKSETENR